MYTGDIVDTMDMVYTISWDMGDEGAMGANGDEGDHYGKDWAEGWNTFWKVTVARSTGVQEHFQIEGVDGVAMLDG